ncbi:MAG TPA: helix-turn-helix domain-containing protein [Rectinemataceae bacterium]|nr:helix-turn-helix domain-containing protein [Rectinemataceae bacterium]
MLPQLRKLGFSDNEARIYLAALELGESSVQRISQKAKLKRTTAYGIIETLRERGLLKTTKNRKKTLYFAEDPRLLKEIAREAERTADAILPSLLAITNLIDRKPKVLYFEGIEGIKELYKETLLYPDSRILGWLSAGSFRTEESWFDRYYRPQRKEKRIYTDVIVPDLPETRSYHKQDQIDFHRTKIDTQSGASIASDILLFGTRHVAILSWEEMTGIVIESAKIHATLSGIFETHWKAL